MKKRYNSYNEYLRQKFGFRVQKVSVNAGFTCPNRDGSVAVGGCFYCNNASFVPSYTRAQTPIEEQIEIGMNHLRKRFKAKKFIVYFQAYTNTYDDVKKLQKLYLRALEHDPDIIGLSVGTRPDCVDEEKIRLFEDLAKGYFVSLEYGIESIYDKTLEFMNRGHNYHSTLEAIELTKERGIHIGAHIILGLPTETEDEMMKMADEVSRLGIDSLKIHNLHIVKNTTLARIYKKNPFHLFTYREYLDFICCFLERLSPKIMIERFFAETPQKLLIAPVWNKSRLEILQRIEEELERRGSYQGKEFKEIS